MTRRMAGLAAAALLAACGPGEPVEPPRPLTEQEPIPFPVDLWDRGVEGETMVLAHVAVTGAVDSVALFRSSGYVQFDSAALQAARRFRFHPAHRGSRPLAAEAKLRIRFSREGGAEAGAINETPR